MALVGLPLAHSLMADTRADEGREYHAYRDLGGVWTICDGTAHGVKPGDVADDEKCDALTAADLLVAVKGAQACAPVLKAPERFQQLRAAVRMNNNTGAFCRGWWRNRASPAKLMQSGKLADGCREFLRYDLVKGKHVKGLTNRRKREAAMCLEGLA